MPELCIFATHPIQYQVPWFRALNEREEVNLTVHFRYLPDAKEQGRGFNTEFHWDIPMLDGYDWVVGRSVSASLPNQKVASLLQSLRTADVVLVTGWHDWYLIAAALGAKIMGANLLVRGESNNLRSRPWYKHLLHYLFLGLFDRFLSIGNANKAFYTRHGVNEGLIHSAPYCVENARFNETYLELRDQRDRIRQEYGISEDTTSFLFAGKFISKKRPGDLLSALSHADEYKQAVHGLLVGDGPLADILRARASHNDLPVTFTGFLNQTEIGRAYTAADVLVLPSNYGETWGLVVNEAMLFGCPAIVSDRVGCGPDLVSDEETGYVVPFQDHEALASKMKEMVKHPDKRKEMGQNARRRVRSHYTIEAAAEGTVDAVQAVSKGQF